MGLHCIVCPDEVIGRGVLLIEEPELKLDDGDSDFTEEGWKDAYEFIDGGGEVTRRFYSVHPTCFEKVYASIFQREGTTVFVMCVGEVGVIIEELGIEGGG